jgi:DNA-binding MarR family transcriptional regulator
MPLTPRQRAFLDRLLDLYRESHQPVHYTEIAARLGVGRTTAYDMLRLLEQKGYVRSEYILADDSGPGRSTVVFTPAARSRAVVRWLAGPQTAGEEWIEVKRRILARISQPDLADHRDLDELLLRLPVNDSPLATCAVAIAALLMNVQRELYARLGDNPVIRSLMSPTVDLQNALATLPGVVLGLGLTESATRQLDSCMTLVQEYQHELAQLDQQMRQDLQAFLREMVVAMDAQSMPQK